MNTQKEVFNKLFKEEKVELATQKVELAMDFNSILKDLNKDVDATNKQQAIISKHAKAFIQAKNPDRSGRVKFQSGRVKAFYKDFSKKAADLGIKVESTMFYKEYQQALNLISQLEDNVGEIKSIVNSVK